MQGSARIGSQWLSLRDYHVCPQRSPALPLHAGDEGALLFLRESAVPLESGDTTHTVLDHDAGWPDFAPGIQRRVLWQRAGQAAMLYYAQPGASVPLHTHGHDEECLMVQGELFLDDVLLEAGDYQLAPAGTGHHTTATDTGVVIYAHGDLDLRFVPQG
jgi:quercetin dioxygenase-like cupin family protein